MTREEIKAKLEYLTANYILARIAAVCGIVFGGAAIATTIQRAAFTFPRFKGPYWEAAFWTMVVLCPVIIVVDVAAWYIRPMLKKPRFSFILPWRMIVGIGGLALFLYALMMLGVLTLKM